MTRILTAIALLVVAGCAAPAEENDFARNLMNSWLMECGQPLDADVMNACTETRYRAYMANVYRERAFGSAAVARPSAPIYVERTPIRVPMIHQNAPPSVTCTTFGNTTTCR